MAKKEFNLSEEIKGIEDELQKDSIRKQKSFLNPVDVLNELEEYIKEFIKRRIFDATMLLGKFNAGELTSIDLREHRQRLKDEAGDKLI